MSQNFTYDYLLQQVPNYSERQDQAFKDQLPTFISLAENRLATDVKLQGYQTVVRGVLGQDPVTPKPAWWKETISFQILVNNVWQDVFMRNLEYLKQYWPNQALTGVPQFYADYDFRHFYVAPTPDEDYQFELTYYARLDPLTPENQENWNTLNAPQALLAAVMVEAARWRANATEEAKWEKAYALAIGGLSAENSERVADRSTVVVPR